MGRIGSVKCLLANWGKPYKHDRNGKTALMAAAETDSGAVVHAIARYDKSGLNVFDECGRTAVYLAAEADCAEAIAALIKAGAAFDQPCQVEIKGGFPRSVTPLQRAKEVGSAAAAKVLVEKGAKLTSKKLIQ